MIKQIKFNALKLAFVPAVLAAFLGFTVLADAGETKIPEISPIETSAQTDDKPLVRCPNKSFLLRTPCKTVKPKTQSGNREVLPEKASVNKNSSAQLKNSSALLP